MAFLIVINWTKSISNLSIVWYILSFFFQIGSEHSLLNSEDPDQNDLGLHFLSIVS